MYRYIYNTVLEISHFLPYYLNQLYLVIEYIDDPDLKFGNYNMAIFVYETYSSIRYGLICGHCTMTATGTSLGVLSLRDF